MDNQIVYLSSKLLQEKGFTRVSKKSIFRDIGQPYFAKNKVVLFYNTPVTKWNSSSFYIGYADMRNGKYHAVQIRWIYKLSELEEIYKALTGEVLCNKSIMKSGNKVDSLP